jgi:hypothetical protein
LPAGYKSQTHPPTHLQKVHVENFSQKKRQKLRCSMPVFPRFFGFIIYHVFGCFSAMAMGVLVANKPCRKQKKQQTADRRKSKTDFLPIFLIAFLGEGSSKTPQRNIKYWNSKSHPGPFLASDPPTHHGGHRLKTCAGRSELRAGPLRLAAAPAL